MNGRYSPYVRSGSGNSRNHSFKALEITLISADQSSDIRSTVSMSRSDQRQANLRCGDLPLSSAALSVWTRDVVPERRYIPIDSIPSSISRTLIPIGSVHHMPRLPERTSRRRAVFLFRPAAAARRDSRQKSRLRLKVCQVRSRFPRP